MSDTVAWVGAGVAGVVAVAAAAVLVSGHGTSPGAAAGSPGVAGAVLAASTASPSPSPSGPAPGRGGPDMRGPGMRGPGFRGFGPEIGGLLGRVLHGESTVSTPNGGTEIVDTQQGTISKIDSTTKTLTVTSTDKVSFTYVVDANTRVVDFAATNPAQATFADLKVGDTVSVVATRSGDTRTAKAVLDGKPTRQAPGHRGPHATASPSTSAASA